MLCYCFANVIFSARLTCSRNETSSHLSVASFERVSIVHCEWSLPLSDFIEMSRNEMEVVRSCCFAIRLGVVVINEFRRSLKRFHWNILVLLLW